VQTWCGVSRSENGSQVQEFARTERPRRRRRSCKARPAAIRNQKKYSFDPPFGGDEGQELLV